MDNYEMVKTSGLLNELMFLVLNVVVLHTWHIFENLHNLTFFVKLYDIT